MPEGSLSDLLPERHDRAVVHEYERAGQGHVFRFLDDLSIDERRTLVSEAREINLDQLESLVRTPPEGVAAEREVSPIDAIRPDDPGRPDALAAGHDLLRSGAVAFLMVAGGQATRLGYSGPKGAYPIAPASGKSLFRWHAEKVIAASRRYGVNYLFFVMVSDATADSTAAHFREQDWFGLEGHVHFVRQRMLPAVDDEGRILLTAKGRIALAPNGHGGVLDALERDGALDRLRDAEVSTVSYFQVDNPLLNAADPAFLGYHVLRGAEMSVKVVHKRHPMEKAGVVCLMDGVPGVLEYSELPDDLARATDESGELRLGLANIAAHVFSVPFLTRVHDHALPPHCARKTIPAIDVHGARSTVAGRKFETFVFDAIPLARWLNVLVTERFEEFEPLKNSEGEHSPETVRRALLDRSASWFRRAGADVPEEPGSLEVSPLDGYDFESFRERLGARGGGSAT